MAEELCAYPGCGKPINHSNHSMIILHELRGHGFVPPAAPEGEPRTRAEILHDLDDPSLGGIATDPRTQALWKELNALRPEAAAPDPKPELICPNHHVPYCPECGHCPKYEIPHATYCTLRKPSTPQEAFMSAEELRELSNAVVRMMDRRRWRKQWPDRVAYLILEVAELGEAVRGKRGDTLEESADVLATFLALTPHKLDEIIPVMQKKVAEFMMRPQYKGETTEEGDIR